MPQATLPLFTSDMTIINFHVGVQKREGKVYYFNGSLPFFHHREDDRESFKHIICQMISNGKATRAEISKAFKIPERSISRWLVVFENEGPGCFYKKKKISRPRIFTPETIAAITALHMSGYSKDEICEELNIKKDSYNKALLQNRLVLPDLPTETETETIKKNFLPKVAVSH